MAKCYLDSNVLVYLKNEASPYHPKARTLVSKLVSEGFLLYLSPLVLDEFLYIFASGFSPRKDKTVFSALERALGEILEIPLIFLVNPPIDNNSQIKVVRLMRQYRLHPRDAYHLLTMQANGIDSLATFDNDFKKVFRDKILSEPL